MIHLRPIKGDLLKTKCVVEEITVTHAGLNQNSEKEIILVVSARISILAWLQIVVFCGFISEPHSACWDKASVPCEQKMGGGR